MLALSSLDGYGTREIARGLGDCSPGHRTTANTFNRSAALHRLAGEEVSFREAAILIFAAHWLTGVASHNFAAIVNGRPPVPRADSRLFSILSTTPCACVLLTLCASVTFARSSDLFT